MAESVLTTDQQIKSIWALGGLTWRELMRRVWGGINRNDLINRAYELAYNFLLAVFPMLLFMLGLLGLLASEGSKLRADLFYYFQLVLPPAANQVLVQTIFEVTPSSTGGKLTFGLLFALYSGSAGMTQLMSTLNAAYEVREERSWIKVHLISLTLTLAMAILLIGVDCRKNSPVGICSGLRGVRVCSDLLLCSQRARTALVLDYAGIGGGSWNVGDRVGCYARLPAFFRYVQQDVRFARGSHHPHAVVLPDGTFISDWQPDQRDD
jgi:hypothetical protein